MPSDWSSFQPRSAYYYTRVSPTSNDFRQTFTSWAEIMRDARVNLGLDPSPYAWNGGFTDAMAQWLRSKGASSQAVEAALAPVRSTPARFDSRLVGLAIWAARFPTLPLSQIMAPQGVQPTFKLSLNDADFASLVYPQYVQQLYQGSNATLPDSNAGPSPAQGQVTTSTSTETGKPPGMPAIIVTGGGGKPEDTTTGGGTAGGSTTGAGSTTGGGGSTGGSTTTTGGGTTGGGTTTTGGGGTAGGAGSAAGSIASADAIQRWRTVLLVIGGVLLLLGVMFTVMRHESPRSLPANV